MEDNMTERSWQRHRRPPDVDEALSSMLWTPYENTTMDDASDADDEWLDERGPRKSCSNPLRDMNDMSASYTPFTSSYFGEENLQLSITTPAHVSNIMMNNASGPALRTTTFVPFSNFFLDNNIAKDTVGTNGDSVKRISAPTKSGAICVTDDFSVAYPPYSCFEQNARLTKLWSSSASSAEPPPYESLYLKDQVNEVKTASENRLEHIVSTCNTSSLDDSKSEDLSAELQSLNLTSMKNLPIAHPHNVDETIDNQLKNHLSNFSNNNNECVSAITLNQIAVAPTGDLGKAQLMNARSQQNKEYNVKNKCNNNNMESMDNLLQAPQQQPDENINTEAPSARGRWTKYKITRTVAAIKNIEIKREALRSAMNHGEHANQPVFCKNNWVSWPVTNLRSNCSSNNNNGGNTNNANIGSNNKADNIRLMNGRANGRQMNSMNAVSAVNATANLFPVRSDTITAESSAVVPLAYNNNNNNSGNSELESVSKQSDMALVVHVAECGDVAIIQSATDLLSGRVVARASAGPQTHSYLHLWKKAINGLRRTTRGYFESSPVFGAATASEDSTFDIRNDALTPNKCLAELERLYAEFRASESAIVAARNECGRVEVCRESAAHGVIGGNEQVTTTNMRLTIPASGSVPGAATVIAAQTGRLDTSCNSSPALKATKFSPASTSSVFLSAPNNFAPSGININKQDESLLIPGDCNNNSNNTSSDHRKVALTAVPPHTNEIQSSLTIRVNSCNTDKHNNTNNNGNCVNSNSISLISLGDAPSSHSRDSGINSTSQNAPKEPGALDIMPAAKARVVNSVNVNHNVSNSVPHVLVGSTSHSGQHINGAPKRDIAAGQVAERVNVICVGDTLEVSSASPKVQASPVATVPSAATGSNANSRTFTSIECQTDDALTVQSCAERFSPISGRDQRRRERRGRRQQLELPTHRRPENRHSLPPCSSIATLHLHPSHVHHTIASSATAPAPLSEMLRPMLPDLLHSHFPPPYSALTLSGCASPVIPQPAQTTLVGPTQLPPPPGTTILTPVISTVPMPNAPPIVSDGRFPFPLPMIRRSPSERSRKGCCSHWFAGPPFRALIAVVALGGVACALGGAALGATGLTGPPSSHLTAALLMIGVGVVLVTVSGAAWRMTAPGGPPCLGLGSAVDLGRCSRRPCRRGGGAPHGLLYPEFQHRPPPPSYQASMQEYRLRLLLLDRDRHNSALRGNSPPPTYRSHIGSLLRVPLTTTSRGGAGSGSINGASEYSLPPSYRSRNAIASGTASSERSIETAPSGRLLSNEDLPELANVEQLPNYSSMHIDSEVPSSSKTSKLPKNQLRTSAILEIATNNCRSQQNTPKKVSAEESPVNAVVSPRKVANDKELVTIVTISKNDSQLQTESLNANDINRNQIEILAHL